MTALPRSIHPETEREYIWRDRALLEADLAELPELNRRKLALLRKTAGSPHARVLTGGHTTHEAGLRLTGQLVAFGCSDTEVEAIVRALLPPGYSGNSLEELAEWIKSARNKGFDQPAAAGARRSATPTQLIMLILDRLGVTFCHDPLGSAFMTVPREGAGEITLNLAGRGAAEILTREVYRRTGQGLRQGALDDILALLKAKALHDGPEETVFTRVARKAESVIIDLGTRDGSAVQITKNGFEVVTFSPVKFARPSGTQPLQQPRQVSNVQEILAKFREILGQPKYTFVLVLAFILNCLRGDGPYMCLLVEGEQGSGKSLLSAILRRIIDPNVAEKMRLPDNERDLMILANQFFLLVFDNASGMRADISDALCCLSTGGGFASRKLYTDADVHIIESMRPFIINGISDVVTRPDLLERAIPVHLKAFEEGLRKTESEILVEFEALLPDLLGALFQIVSHALHHEAGTAPPRAIRMADAAHWLQAAEAATGLPEGKLVGTVAQAQIDRVSERIDNEPIVVALKVLLEAGPFEGTMGELLERFSVRPRSRYFPETATRLSKELDRLKTGMVKVGLFFERLGRSNKGQQVRVWMAGQENQPPQPKPPPGPFNY